MEAKKGYSAFARGLPMSAKKVRPVADEIRRQPYTKAIAILENMPNKSAWLLKKVVMSAAANALYANKQLDESSLVVAELMVDEGPSMTRIWPRARGRADQLKKRSCHISVVVDEIGAKK